MRIHRDDVSRRLRSGLTNGYRINSQPRSVWTKLTTQNTASSWGLGEVGKARGGACF